MLSGFRVLHEGPPTPKKNVVTEGQQLLEFLKCCPEEVRNTYKKGSKTHWLQVQAAKVNHPVQWGVSDPGKT